MIIFIFIDTGFANQFQGIVKFNYDYALDGKLNAKQFYKMKLIGTKDLLKGHYIEINNDSSWEFKFYNSRGTIIVNALQLDDDFYRVMSGEVIGNKIIGTWFSVGGLKGDFQIIGR